jgi:hypothetical protein
MDAPRDATARHAGATGPEMSPSRYSFRATRHRDPLAPVRPNSPFRSQLVIHNFPSLALGGTRGANQVCTRLRHEELSLAGAESPPRRRSLDTANARAPASAIAPSAATATIAPVDQPPEPDVALLLKAPIIE